MRLFRAIIVLPFILGVVVVSMPPLRAAVPIELADTFILKYDKKGRATGIKARKSKKKPSKTNKSKRRSKAPAAFPDDMYEENEVLVTNPDNRFFAAYQELGFSLTEKLQLPQLGSVVYRLLIPPRINVPEARLLLKARFPKILIDPNHHFFLARSRRSSEKLPRMVMGWPKSSARCGAGVRIGMIDSGVDLRHPALSGRKIEYHTFRNNKRRPGSKDHGTAIAAMLVGIPEWGGLLPGAELKVADIFETDSSGRMVATAANMMIAINWMLGKNVHAINISVAGGNNRALARIFKSIGAAKSGGIFSGIFKNTGRKGPIVVAAAGNWGRKGFHAYPAAYDNVLAVTAIDQNGNAYSQASTGDYIDFAAIGVGVLTAAANGREKLRNGTSFAVPFVTSLVATKVAREGHANPEKIRKYLISQAVDLGKAGRDKIFGWGYIKSMPDCAE